MRILARGIAILVFCSFMTLAGAAQARAQQGPEDGGHELEFWTGGGHSIRGGTHDIGVWNAGVRYGWIITGDHGPGFLRGSFEYAVDAEPIFIVFQPANTAQGIGFSPFALKWNFKTRHNVVPYFEIGGGMLFSRHEVPTGASTVNFTSGGAVGVHFLRGKHAWSAEIRVTHISDAGMTKFNPGINTLQARFGFGLFTHPRN